MEEMMMHTPTKWSIHKRSDEPVGTLIIGDEGQNVADCSSWHTGRAQDVAAANAAYIVHCVNSHASLVEENKRMREALEATRALVSEASATGFNWQDGDWADRLYKNNGSITKALKGDTNA